MRGAPFTLPLELELGLVSLLFIHQLSDGPARDGLGACDLVDFFFPVYSILVNHFDLLQAHHSAHGSSVLSYGPFNFSKLDPVSHPTDKEMQSTSVPAIFKPLLLKGRP